MGGLLTLLLFAGLFYLMMRFDCGAHAVHGHGHDARHEVAGSTDPVCGMDVKPDQGYTVTHAGHEYRLCSRACLDKFEANPSQYVTAHRGEGGVR